MVPAGTQIDVQWLREKVSWAKKQMARVRRRKRSSETDEERAMLVELVEAANVCAEWMLATGQSARTCVGPFSPQLSLKGDSVRVKPGAEVLFVDDNDGLTRSVSQRSYPVTVLRSFRGYIDKGKSGAAPEDRIVHPRIEWEGKGGIVKWTDANNVQ